MAWWIKVAGSYIVTMQMEFQTQCLEKHTRYMPKIPKKGRGGGEGVVV